MCSGGDDRRREAERRQRELDEEAARRQARLDELAAQREQQAAEQQASMAELAAQQADAVAAANAETARLQTEQTARIAGIEAQNNAATLAVQQEADAKAGRLTRAGNVASASLRAMNQGQLKAPTAQQTRRGAKKGGARTNSPGYSRGSGSSRGTNLSI